MPEVFIRALETSAWSAPKATSWPRKRHVPIGATVAQFLFLSNWVCPPHRMRALRLTVTRVRPTPLRPKSSRSRRASGLSG
jgi:hypothetical protein